MTCLSRPPRSLQGVGSDEAFCPYDTDNAAKPQTQSLTAWRQGRQEQTTAQTGRGCLGKGVQTPLLASFGASVAGRDPTQAQVHPPQKNVGQYKSNMDLISRFFNEGVGSGETSLGHVRILAFCARSQGSRYLTTYMSVKPVILLR